MEATLIGSLWMPSESYWRHCWTEDKFQPVITFAEVTPKRITELPTDVAVPPNGNAALDPAAWKDWDKGGSKSLLMSSWRTKYDVMNYACPLSVPVVMKGTFHSVTCTLGPDDQLVTAFDCFVAAVLVDEVRKSDEPVHLIISKAESDQPVVKTTKSSNRQLLTFFNLKREPTKV